MKGEIRGDKLPPNRYNIMQELIDYTMRQVLRLAVTDIYQYATGAVIVVAVFGFIYKLTGKGKPK